MSEAIYTRVTLDLPAWLDPKRLFDEPDDDSLSDDQREVVTLIRDVFDELWDVDGLEWVDGEQTVEMSGAANYGTGAFGWKGHPSWIQLLMDHGIPFVIQCESKYEFGGERILWRPGMDEPRRSGVDVDGEITLTASEFVELTKGRSPIQAVEAISAHFTEPSWPKAA